MMTWIGYHVSIAIRLLCIKAIISATITKSMIPARRAGIISK